MAGNLTDTAETLVLDALLGTTAWAPTTPLKLKLMTVQGTDSAAGTEVVNSGGSTYGSQTITFAGTTTGTGTTSNSNAITFANMPNVTVVGFEIWDTNATAKRLWWIPATTNKTTNLGDTYSVAIGAITLSID